MLGEIFRTFFRLGCTSFGGPTAHLGYFHDEFVLKKKWLSDTAFADLTALCMALPGPTSSQIGISIGLSKGGIPGAVLAWLGFTLPSAIIMILLGFGVASWGDSTANPWLHGLKIAAVAVVAQAIYSMAIRFTGDRKRIVIALFVTAFTLIFPSTISNLLMIFVGGMAGTLFLKTSNVEPHIPLSFPLNRKLSHAAIIIFVALLICLPLARQTIPMDSPSSAAHALKISDSFFRAGSLVFGGGHIVLPILQTEVVPQGWVSREQFMTGYGLAQALPGPLFSFAAYLGAVSPISPNGILGGVLALVAIFLPSFLILIGVIPIWDDLRQKTWLRDALIGVNAAVVGLLLSAFYDPVWKAAILNGKDFAIALVALVFLMFLRLPSWSVVLLSAALGKLVTL